LACRVEEWNGSLRPLQAIEREHADQAEQQHADRIASPMLFLRFIDATDRVGQALEGAQHWREERPLADEDARHVAAERLGDCDDDRAEDRDLNPPVESHGEAPWKLEPLGADQGVNEIGQEAQ
jgi:hypothetical protein